MTIPRFARTFAVTATAIAATAVLAPAATANVPAGYTWDVTFYSDASHTTVVGEQGCYNWGEYTSYTTRVYVDCSKL